MTNRSDVKPICRWSLLLIMAGWFLLSLFVGETELLSVLPAYFIPLTVGGLSAILILGFLLSKPLRRCLYGFDLRLFVALHLVRFVGIYFLVLNARGLLPREFALPAGWGDVVVALGALVLLGNERLRQTKWILLGWNIVGLIDILVVVKIAGAIILERRELMSVMTHLPLSFLPTMVVPLIIFSHVVIFGGLQSARTEETSNNRMGIAKTSNPILEHKAI